MFDENRLKVRRNKIMKLANIYEDFMREAWKRGINDSLIASIMPIGHSAISKRRREIRQSACCGKLNEYMISRLFQILDMPEYRKLIHGANPLRTEHDVKFWSGNQKLFDYFMDLRMKLINKIAEENNTETEIEISEDFTSNVKEVKFTDKDVKHLISEDKTTSEIDSSVKEHEFLKGVDFKNVECNSIEASLRTAVLIAIMQGKYSIARDVIITLQNSFEEN